MVWQHAVLIAGGVVCILLLVKIVHDIYWDRATKSMLKDFEEAFPDRCPYCSFHRYGIQNGYVKPDEPPPKHFPCIDRAYRHEKQ